MTTTILNIVFSGLFSALVIFLLNRRAVKTDAQAREAAEHERDNKLQTTLEQWEYRKYKANQKLFTFRNLTELFCATRTEIFFLGLDLTNADAMLLATEQATHDFLIQSNPQISVQDLEAQKTYLMAQQKQQIIDRKIARIGQYNNAVKGIQGRAYAEVSIASHYLDFDQVDVLQHLLKTLSQKVDVGTPAQVDAVLKTFDATEMEFRKIQKAILNEIDASVRVMSTHA